MANWNLRRSRSHKWWVIFPQQQNFAMGSLAQISSGAIRCSFRRVPVKIPAEAPGVPVKISCEVPEVSGAAT